MCSLQEAYSIPSFDTVNKKKNSTKSKSYSLPDKNKFYDSSNEYDFDNGKEFATAWNKYGKEDFQNMPDKPYGELGKSRSDTDKNQNMNIKTPYIGTDTISNTSSYKGRAQDINYWCKENGVGCPDILPETFENPSSCKSYPQFYNIPQLNNKTKEEYDIAMNAAVNQNYSSTQSMRPPMRHYDISKLQGYIDDDDNEYLSLKQNRRNIIETSDTDYRKSNSNFSSDKIYRPYDNNLVEHMSMKGNNYSYDVYGNKNYQYTFDIALFILAGILIIFLCDQIYRIAALSGMKETISVLSPILKDLEKLKV